LLAVERIKKYGTRVQAHMHYSELLQQAKETDSTEDLKIILLTQDVGLFVALLLVSHCIEIIIFSTVYIYGTD